MRKEPYVVGSYVHVVKRGIRGMPIVRDESDRQRFLLMLRYFNDAHCPLNWYRDVAESSDGYSYDWPEGWPEQQKIVEIACFCLVENHFHLLLKEIVDGGISKFMKRLGIGMAKHFNEKYGETGSLFQGAYKSKTVSSDTYLRYVSAYIQVKNAFELYPGGYSVATRDFERSYEWAERYPYCSLGDFTGVTHRQIIDLGILQEIFLVREYKEFANEFIQGRALPPEKVTLE